MVSATHLPRTSFYLVERSRPYLQVGRLSRWWVVLLGRTRACYLSLDLAAR